MFVMVIGLSWFSTWAQVDKLDKDVNDRIARYKADKNIDFENWPKEGKIIKHPHDISDTLVYFSTNANFLKDHELSEIKGMKYERYIYRAWRERDGQKEELSIWITVMESVIKAHEYLLLRWANVSTPFIKHAKGVDVGLNVGEVCYAIPYPKGGIQVAWFIRANTVVEIDANGSFATQVDNLAKKIDFEIKKSE